jgi:peptidyl-prolyl cis-trans isomerase SurA
VDLSLIAGEFSPHVGEYKLQVESFLSDRRHLAVLVLCGCALLAPVAGCKHSPAPDVMATVNGKEILRADLDKYYAASLGDNPQQPSPEQAEIVKLNILKQMIDDEILQQRAAKLTLAASDEDVNAKFTEMKAPYTQEDFEKLLKQRNLTEADFKRDMRRQLTKTKLLNKEIESKINVTDAEIAAYYSAHKADFNLIEPQYHLAQIVVTSGPAPQTGNLQNNKAAGDADAKKKIQAIHQHLDSGEDFGALAMNFSEDGNTSSNGGDMGFVAESALHSNPDAYNAISKLKPNQITDILPIYDPANPGHRTIGYAIYKLIAREQAGQRELHDPRVQQAIHQLLHEGRAQLLRNAYLEMLHDEAKIHNYLADQILKEDAH